MKQTIRILCLSWLIMIPFSGKSQEMYREMVVYTDLKEAMKNPLLVESVSLVGMNLKKIPKEVFEFKNLKVLEIRRNKLTKIPEEISTLTKLEELDLSQNKIEELPKEIGMLKRLRIFKVRKNKLLQIPKEIGELNKLELLDLNNNPVFTLPSEIQFCLSLRQLDIRNSDIGDEQRPIIESLLPGVEILFHYNCNCGPNN